MSLRFNRNAQPKWSAKKSWIEFVCDDPAAHISVRCAVSQAALEDATGEAIDSRHGVAVFSRHLGRIMAAANQHYAAEGLKNGIIVVDGDDLLPAYSIAHQLAAAVDSRLRQRA